MSNYRTRFGLVLVFFLFSCVSGGDAKKQTILSSNEVTKNSSDEVVALTQELIRTQPVNPPGDEAGVAQVIAERLRKEGIRVELHPFDGDTRLNLLARLPGKNPALRPLLLVGHSDVVPAQAKDWDAPATPFKGEILDGILYGRGSLDMLSMVALETMTMAFLKRQAQPYERDLILLVVGDEEVDGRGMQSAIVQWPEILNAEWAINEGAFLLQDYFKEGEDIAAVSVAQKGVLQIEIRTKGASGHGSSPSDDDASARLIRATAKILGRENPLTLTEETQKMFYVLGQARGGVNGYVMQNPFLLEHLARGSLKATPTTSALVHNTCALTILEAGYKRNVIPAEAVATFDCRLLPQVEPMDFRDHLLRLVDDPHVEFKVLMAGRANSSNPESRVLDVIGARIEQEFPGTATAPILTKGLTDSRFLRERGVSCYGFIPIRVSKEELASLHGRNEKVRVSELKKAFPRLIDVVATLLSSGNGAP
jgi:acetylornithine deacetylase/succinyl-diaminopimelate desuccinylase-like protein